ncbi:MAG: DUF2007 domain-containing protein [Desulfuromonas sp.]|nr:DUF2007 domain-containing protein [Desulfuromonas sp.]
MPDKLVTIATFSTPLDANMAKSALESADIPVFIADEFTIGINWLYSNALGGVKVQVPESLACEARGVLSSQIETPTTDESSAGQTCPQCNSEVIEDFLDKRGSFLTWLLLGIPLLLPSKKKRCRDCGHVWKLP